MLMFANPCIIVKFMKKKIQQDATMYQNFYYFLLNIIKYIPTSIFKSLLKHYFTK